MFGSLKKSFNRHVDGWLKWHPGVPMTIYDIPVVLKETLLLSTTPSNIQNGFLVTGIWPFNRDIFTDDDFLPSEVRNREYRGDTNNSNMISQPDESLGQPNHPVTIRHSTPSPEPSTCTVGCSTRVSSRITPQQLKPFPKAPPRNQKVNRRKRKSAGKGKSEEKSNGYWACYKRSK